MTLKDFLSKFKTDTKVLITTFIPIYEGSAHDYLDKCDGELWEVVNVRVCTDDDNMPELEIDVKAI